MRSGGISRGEAHHDPLTSHGHLADVPTRSATSTRASPTSLPQRSKLSSLPRVALLPAVLAGASETASAKGCIQHVGGPILISLGPIACDDDTLPEQITSSAYGEVRTDHRRLAQGAHTSDQGRVWKGPPGSARAPSPEVVAAAPGDAAHQRHPFSCPGLIGDARTLGPFHN